MSPHKRIEEIAAYWVSREEASDWTPKESAQLQAWLNENTAHRVAWLRLKSVWQRADRLAAVRVTQHPTAHPRGRAIRWASAAAVAFIAVLAGLHWPGQGTRYSTEVGARQTVPLSDGSRLELNTKTVLRAKVEPHERTVWLDRGEAFFDVKSDPKHPFVIHAGNHRVVVLGTKFSVRSEGEHLEVAVLEGSVRVEPLEADQRKPPVVVEGGAMLFSKSAGTVIAMNALSRVEKSLSWRHGILVFDQSTLADVAAQFNRYNDKQLLVTDPETAQIRVGGSFDATGVEAFARLLHHGFNLRVETHGEEIRVSQPD